MTPGMMALYSLAVLLIAVVIVLCVGAVAICFVIVGETKTAIAKSKHVRKGYRN